MQKSPPIASDSHSAAPRGYLNGAEVPRELECGLTRVVRDIANLRIALPMALFMFAVFVLLAYRAHSVWVYFIPPLLGPLLVSGILVVEPYNPYVNVFVAMEGRNRNDFRTDPNAQRLLSMLRSRKARLVSLRTGFLLAASLCMLMVLIAIFQASPFISKLDPLDLVFNTFGFCVASLGVHIHYLLAWAFQEWRRAD